MKFRIGVLFLLCVLIAVFGCAGAMASGTAQQSSGQLTDTISWTLSDTGVLTIDGRGRMPDYGNGDPSPFHSNLQITSVVIGNRIDNVGARIFMNASNLASVSLPAGLMSVGYGAFCNTGLTEVVIPAGVDTIGETSFYGCPNLSNVTVMNPVVAIYEDTFVDCAAGLVIHGWAGSLVEEYADAKGITFDPITSGTCGANATWTLDPQTGALTISGTGALEDYHDYNPSPFLDNPFITSVVIGNRIDNVGTRMFAGASNLTSVSLPAGLMAIDYGAFGRTGLTEVVIPAGVAIIGDNAFYGCPNLADVTVMNPTVEIYEDTFDDCASSLVIHGWAGSLVEEYADAKGITFDPITSGTCGANAAWTLDPQTGALTISGRGALEDYHDYNPSPFLDNPFITSVVIGNRIDNVGTRMFAGASNLTSVSLPAGLMAIDYGAFGRTGLTEVVIPAGVAIIGDNAFYGCPNLADVTVMNPTVEIYEDTFDDCASSLVIHGWAGSLVEEYADAKGITFDPITSGTCGANAAWTLDPQTGALTISGTGALEDYHDYNPSPFLDNPFITSVVIGNRIDNVGTRMFAGASNLTSVSLPAGLKSIGYGAFARTGLTEVVIPAGITVIGDIAFYSCTNLISATIVDPSVLIYEETFLNCSPSLVIYGWGDSPAETYANENSISFVALNAPDHKFVFPENLTEIGSEAFTEVSAFSVVIPPTVTTISGNPFAGSSVRIVFGYEGTAAETFANTYGYMFASLGIVSVGR